MVEQQREEEEVWKPVVVVEWARYTERSVQVPHHRWSGADAIGHRR